MGFYYHQEAIMAYYVVVKDSKDYLNPHGQIILSSVEDLELARFDSLDEAEQVLSTEQERNPNHEFSVEWRDEDPQPRTIDD
jgi:hypothetical protein